MGFSNNKNVNGVEVANDAIRIYEGVGLHQFV
jgi:hypothetical protein